MEGSCYCDEISNQSVDLTGYRRKVTANVLAPVRQLKRRARLPPVSGLAAVGQHADHAERVEAADAAEQDEVDEVEAQFAHLRFPSLKTCHNLVADRLLGNGNSKLTGVLWTVHNIGLIFLHDNDLRLVIERVCATLTGTRDRPDNAGHPPHTKQ